METLMDSLSCINTHHSDDELLKEKEEELLYGAGEDGDEEDALSDDSMRLRVSDDDEPEEVFTSISNDTKIKTELTKQISEDIQPSAALESDTMVNNTSGCDVNQEEHKSGNVSMDDKIVNDHEKDVKAKENGDMRSQVASISHCPWPSYESQWRFTSFPRNRLFHNVNRFSYTRHNYFVPNKHYRTDSYNYYNRFNTFPYFERGRGGGICSPYYRGSNNDRKQTNFSKSITKSKPATPTKYNQTFVSSCNKSTPPINKSVADSKSQIVENNALNNENLSNCKKDNCSLRESMDKEIKSVKAGDKNSVNFNTSNGTNSLELKKETTFAEENEERLKTLPSSKDIETTDSITINTGTSNDMSVEKITNSSIKLQDSNNESSGITNAKSDARHFYSSDNSKKMETSLNKSMQHKSDTNNSSECIERDNESIQKEQRPSADGSDLIMKKCERITESGKLKISGDKTEVIIKACEITESTEDVVSLQTSEEKELINTESIANGTVTHEDEEQFCRRDDDAQSKKNEDDMHDIHTINTIIFGNLDKNGKRLQGDTNIEKSQNNSTSEPATENGQHKKPRLCHDNESTSSETITKAPVSEDQSSLSKHDVHKHGTDVKEDTVKSDNENDVKSGENKNQSPIHAMSKQSEQNKNIVCRSEKSNLLSALLENNKQENHNENLPIVDENSGSVKSVSSLASATKTDSGDTKKKNAEVPITNPRRKRRTKRLLAAIQETAALEDKQVKESGRQKRRTARNAEEIIRKKFLNHDSDLESSDGSDKFVVINHKMSQDARSLSPPSLKRNCPDTDSATINGITKKVKAHSETVSNEMAIKENKSQNIKELNYVHKFFQRDLKEKLPKLKQEELEELLIQKIVETITMRGEIGRLREQARISEKNQEATRARCQQLTKQIKDFEMVLTRNAADRRANNDKPTAPIKINRSVGLQVNFMTEHGMQNLRQLQQNASMKSLPVSNGGNTSSSEANNNTNATSPRRGIKVRSPRRVDSSAGVQTNVVPPNHTQSPPIISTVTPTALVVTKPVESQHPLTLPTQAANVQQILPNQQTHSQQQQQAVVLNGKLPNQVNRQSTTITVAKPRTNDLIDLTDEEEKSKAAVSIPVVTTAITDQQVTIAQKPPSCFPRVIQTIPGSVAITTQPASIRVVQPSSQPTPTALVNNMNAPRLAYVMQSSVGSTRQLLITPTTNQMRPATSTNRPSYSTLTYKTGISTVANGTVRVLTTPATNVHIGKHPAPLPDTRNHTMNPLWKLPPPAPSLKISKVANGIVLSWNMNLSDKYSDIASYQLYAYQEVAGIPPSTSLWKKVGDVRALPLPMACTLTQFSEGNNYYFAVRAVDTHSRKGLYSIPGNISL